MSEEILKKFYRKILNLLQEKTSPSQGISHNKVIEILKDGQNTPASEILVRLGLHDIAGLVGSLKGQDIQNFSVEKIQCEPIALSYLEESLPVLQSYVMDLKRHHLPDSTVKCIENIQDQLFLWQKMIYGMKQNDFFPIMHSLMKSYPLQDEKIKKLITATLKKIGLPVVIALVHSLYQEKDKNHKDIPELLKEMGDLAIPALILALHYPEESVRCAAANVLQRIKAKESVNALLECSDDPSWKVRKALIEALGEIGIVEAIPGLVKALKDKHAGVRLEATKALGKVQSPKILPCLLSLLKDPSWEIRKEAVEAMAKFKEEANPYLANALGNDSLVVRKIASRLLVQVATKEAIPALKKAIEDQDISVRERCLMALGRILEGEESTKILKIALEDKAPLVRFAAIHIIMNFGDKIGMNSILYLLNKAIKDSDPTIRQRANVAINEILKKEKR
ncbi:MAG: HEAT repeat domain-containing protein [Candidatus Brocadiae bacterium]|nr:HEAT repeat domain-containing protein [Candidatus Brocadiia bacterium]